MAKNFFIGHGRLIKDIDVSEVKNGTLKLAKGCFAINRDKENADFINFFAYGSRAETMAKYLSKGSEVILSGRLSSTHYKDKDGKTIYKTELMVEDFDFCGTKKDSQKAETNTAASMFDVGDVTPIPEVPDFVNVDAGVGELPFA